MYFDHRPAFAMYTSDNVPIETTFWHAMSQQRINIYCQNSLIWAWSYKTEGVSTRRPPTTIQLTPQAIPIENAQWPPAVFTSASLPLNTMIATADSLVTHVPYTQSGLRCTELEQWNAEQLQFIHMRSSSANPLCWRYETHWMRIRKPIPMVFFL